ncbi:MAG: D-glycero-beta-D-manno-heptose 1-phosphate adenylyltransferase [Proteobacteria bacterium]|jgi:rfaE bifunctional protein nucleotidyltransferase chain/domain|nr:D-glycero-beta-D-manno-heptose 1-phosphate adenylyltransferase [Pseudomonadota bacterium]
MILSSGTKKFIELNQGKKIVFTNGCFDILHRGHVTYLSEARKLGDLLVVGVNSDASVKRLKGPSRPINSEADRAFVLLGLKTVDAVEIFTEDTPLELIKLIRPHVLVKGGDWKIEQIVGGTEVLSWGGRVLSLNFVNGFSTTSIIERSRA